MIYPVIICGGSGTRLWPLSRKSYPKQFSKLLGEHSLFQQSAARVIGDNFADPIIVTSDDFRFIVTEQLAGIEKVATAIIIEPEAKNTAPAVLSAALMLHKIDPESSMLVMPSDQIIENSDAFQNVVKNANQTLDNEADILVTFGISPTSPETGYGYLELANKEDAESKYPVKLCSFVEKPNFENATKMVESQKYLWNSGIFLFKTSSIIKAFEKHAPAMIKATKLAVEQSKTDLNFVRLDTKSWAKIDGNSIDYAIMEKADNIVAMPFSEGWSDLGSWDSVWKESSQDKGGNVCSENALAINCKNTLLRSESNGLELIGIGLDDIIAIAMPDAVLVAKKSESQAVKDAVDALKSKSKKQATAFPKEHRPWGWFESLVISKDFQVKRIFVKSGASLSLQSHFHRSEHWVVVEGTARVTLGDNVKLYSANESVYIPIGEKHRLENPGKLPVVLIEVQTGSYLGEDDIVRYEDIYKRN